MVQQFSSKETSVNTTRLPALIKKIDWEVLKKIWEYQKTGIIVPKVLDIGAGKKTDHIQKFFQEQGFEYVPYDPYYLSKEENEKALKCKPFVVICSNVLNVIKEPEIRHEVHNLVRELGYFYFISVYEGDRSGVGKQTKKDCYQCNQPTKFYLRGDEEIRKGIIHYPHYTGEFELIK